MTQFIIAGLVLLCLLSVGVSAYLVRALARVRREQEEARQALPSPLPVETHTPRDEEQTAAQLEEAEQASETTETTGLTESAELTGSSSLPDAIELAEDDRAWV